MATLTEQQKLYLIERLACFDSPSELVHAVKQEFGIVVTKQQVSSYDPTTLAGKRLSAELKQVFLETRQQFLENVIAIPIANRAYRLRQLQKIIDNPSNARNAKLVRETLKQAAEEVGGAFTNKRLNEHSGPGGKPIEITSPALSEAEKELAAWCKQQAALIPDLLHPPTE